MSWLKKSYISQGLAIFFFFFTVADLVNPHLCGEEMGLVSLPASLDRSLAPDQMIAIAPTETSADSHREEPPTPTQNEEDCFCCCSHILPSQSFTVESVGREPLGTDPFMSALPAGPTQHHYHPPRLS